jgi:hypothetical protein
MGAAWLKPAAAAPCGGLALANAPGAVPAAPIADPIADSITKLAANIR